MTTTRLDKAYGRRGGRLIPGGVTPTGAPCKTCGLPLTAGQRSTHHLCRDGIVGQRCNCPPDCTTETRIGDGPRPCHPDCPVCATHTGRLHKDVFA